MQVLLTEFFKEKWLHVGARLVNCCWAHQHSPTCQPTGPSGGIILDFLPMASFLSLVCMGSTNRLSSVIIATHKVAISLQKTLAHVFNLVIAVIFQQHLSFLEKSLQADSLAP